MFAEKLKELRKDHGLSQTEMGQRLHLSQPAYCRLEHNEHPMPHHIERINKVFGVDASAWLEPMDPPMHGENDPQVKVVYLKGSPAFGSDEQDDSWVDRFARDLKRVIRILRGESSQGGGGNRSITTTYQIEFPTSSGRTNEWALR